ncbi:MAG: hypothetical protein ACXIT9_00565 [Nitritalea sp.]
MTQAQRIQGNTYEETLLVFTYPGVGSYYISAQFKGDRVLLPVGELFNVLGFFYERMPEGFGIQGGFEQWEPTWRIDPVGQTIWVEGQTFRLEAEEVFLGETDFYLNPARFEQHFGLVFTVNPLNLQLSLNAQRALPVLQKRKRDAERDRRLGQLGQRQKEDYVLSHPLRRDLFRGGMVDYQLASTISTEGFLNFARLGFGAELLGGDVLLAASGFQGDQGMRGFLQQARWRYVFEGGMRPDDNVEIATASLGVIPTTGITAAQVLGVAVSNDPVIPRLNFGTYLVDGFTEPDSEVELFVNGQLLAFERAQEDGYFKFDMPLTYGSVRVLLRFFTPQGEIFTEERQIQIPFNFLPKGFLSYNVQSGFLQDPQSLTFTDRLGFSSVLAYGVRDHLTFRVGTEANLDTLGQQMNPYAGFSARIYDQYLLNVDVQPGRLYQAAASVFYPSNASVNLQFTEYDGASMFNPGGLLREANANTFYPFLIGKQQSGIRLGANRFWRPMGDHVTGINADFNSRVGRVIGRIGYRGIGLGVETGGRVARHLINSSLTYTLPRLPGFPVFVRGMFLRGQIIYSADERVPLNLSASLSQTLFKRGRLNLNYDRQVASGSNLWQVSFFYDFTPLRFINQSTVRGKQVSTSTSVFGSVAYDPSNRQPYFTNREQIGLSGAAFRMFIDENDNGVYDEGEEVVPAKGVRLNLSANAALGKDGILRVTQLQSYWKYQVTLDQKFFADPTLAAQQDGFAFIAPPNHIQLIDIPLYRTGVIEGVLLNEEGGEMKPKGGMRLRVERALMDEEDGLRWELTETLKTFSDGSFYTYNLRPGTYRLRPDEQQLAYMMRVFDEANSNAVFTIRALADGDFVEGLRVELAPSDKEEESRYPHELRQRVHRLTEEAEAAYARKDFENAWNLAREAHLLIPSAEREALMNKSKAKF